jgi:hypothetical protein
MKLDQPNCLFFEDFYFEIFYTCEIFHFKIVFISVKSDFAVDTKITGFLANG